MDLVAEKLSGRWILIGGTLLPALGREVRATQDIDFIGLGPRERAAQLELMAIAEELELPIESINQAAGYYLEKLKTLPSDFLPIRSNKRIQIFRPSFRLYLELKIQRLSESDLLDLIEYLDFCQANGDSLAKSSLENLVNDHLKRKPPSSPGNKGRLKILLTKIKKI